MPVDTQCKIKYLSGLGRPVNKPGGDNPSAAQEVRATGGDGELIPRQVFRHLSPNSKLVPANPTQLAEVMGVKQQSLQGWYQKMPLDQQDRLAEKYGFTHAIRRSWGEDDCRTFVEIYEKYWMPELRKRQAAETPGVRIKPSPQSSAFEWNPPTTKDQILKRLKAIALEQRTGVSGGTIVLAVDALTFEEEETSILPSHGEALQAQPQCIRKDGQRPQSKDGDLATLELRSPAKNDRTPPWPLHIDLNLGKSDGLFVREARVEFELGGDAQAEEFAKRKQFPGSLSVVSPDGRSVRFGLSVTPGGDSFTPYVTVKLRKGPIGPFTAYEILTLEKLSAGHEIKTRLVVPIKDLEDEGSSVSG